MKADLYIKNGLVVTEETMFHGGVVITDGKIVELVEGDTAVSAQETIDVKGKAILPGIGGMGQMVWLTRILNISTRNWLVLNVI